MFNIRVSKSIRRVRLSIIYGDSEVTGGVSVAYQSREVGGQDE